MTYKKPVKITTNHLCEYGCGKTAQYETRAGKKICESSSNKCSVNRNKNSSGLIKHHASNSGYEFTEEDRRKGIAKYNENLVKTKLVEYSTIGNAKRLLIEVVGVENKCSECGLHSVWNNKPIVMHLDHINGNNRDFRIANLRLLCPNCHSQTETYCGTNINTGKVKVSDEKLIEAIKSNTNIRKVLMSVGLAPKGGNYDRVKLIMAKYNLSFA